MQSFQAGASLAKGRLRLRDLLYGGSLEANVDPKYVADRQIEYVTAVKKAGGRVSIPLSCQHSHSLHHQMQRRSLCAGKFNNHIMRWQSK